MEVKTTEEEEEIETILIGNYQIVNEKSRKSIIKFIINIINYTILLFFIKFRHLNNTFSLSIILD